MEIRIFWEGSTVLPLLLLEWFTARYTRLVQELATQNADTVTAVLPYFSIPPLPALPAARRHCSLLTGTQRRLLDQDVQGENSLCSTAVNKQQLKSNEICIVGFSFFKCQTSIAWLFAVKSCFSPRTPSKHSVILLPRHLPTAC